MKLIMK